MRNILALPPNISIDIKLMPSTNNLAYFCQFPTCGLSYKNNLIIVSDACTINVTLSLALPLANVINYGKWKNFENIFY
jgi:hypothetical protein